MTNNPRNHPDFDFWRPTIACIFCVLSFALRPLAAAESHLSNLEKARGLVHSSPKEKCLSLARAALAKSPNSAEWNEVMASCLLAKEDVTAVKYAEKALALKPTSSRIMTTCALVWLHYSDRLRAHRLALHAIRTDPTDGRAYAILGSCYFSTGDAMPAAEHFSRALELSPNDFDVNELAMEYFGHMLDDRSMECANRMVKNYPDSAEAYCDRGKLKRGEQNPSQGLSDFDKAIALDPNVKSARFLRGKLWARLIRPKEAIADFDREMKQQPDSAPLHCRRASQLVKIGAKQKGLDDYNTAIRLANAPAVKSERIFAPSQRKMISKDYMRAWIQRLQLEIDLGYQGLALSDADQILKIDHACDAALAIRQELLRKKGRFADALADLDILVKLNPDVPEWYEARADVYKKLNKPQEAAADTAKAKHIDEFGK
jgi:tetratricopeptide (TPR) repeat protein